MWQIPSIAMSQRSNKRQRSHTPFIGETETDVPFILKERLARCREDSDKLSKQNEELMKMKQCGEECNKLKDTCDTLKRDLDDAKRYGHTQRILYIQILGYSEQVKRQKDALEQQLRDLETNHAREMAKIPNRRWSALP